jgi:hypothetical protein
MRRYGPLSHLVRSSSRERLVVDRNDIGRPAVDTRGVSEERKAPGMAMRIVLELSREDGTVTGTLTTGRESRSFWGWLELMSALELATGVDPCKVESSEVTNT